MDKVSAIITTHNRIFFLKKAIESVENQTYKNIEIIVVDDCSDDGTREYCLKKNNITYIYIDKEHHKNGNYSRNLGIKKSTGKYLAFLDDDDEWNPQKIELQMQYFEKNPDCSLVSCLRTIEINESYIMYDNQKNTDLDNYKKRVFYELFGTTSTYLVTKEATLSIGMFDEKLDCWQDVEFVTNMACHYKIGFINEYLVFYRRILNDKKRISNAKIERWEKAVKYINNKYTNELNALNHFEKKKRSLFILKDKAARFDSLNDKKNRRKVYKEIYKTDKNIKNLIKWILNISSLDIIRVKLWLKK